MMKLENPNELQSAFILLKCSKKTHDDCRKIRNALIKDSYGYVQEAFTTNAIVDNETWCVAASALVPANEAKKFEKHLQDIHTDEKNPVAVKKLKFVLNKQ
ncbi:MAG: hypothetical protein COV65_03490 [Nitrosopumilales archaeon CG11_big_fil_rev_8_21_14_0_20_33_24]|nr:MAG: hypothetical protein COV65_03490 [Nitrosopumilales archaeon CG11_big_fil_rev_8_21_14_0_20_33_24]